MNAATDTVRSMPRSQQPLTPAQLRRLQRSASQREASEAHHRAEVLAVLAEASFSAVSEATGLSTNTLQRWKREAQS